MFGVLRAELFLHNIQEGEPPALDTPARHPGSRDLLSNELAF